MEKRKIVFLWVAAMILLAVGVYTVMGLNKQQPSPMSYSVLGAKDIEDNDSSKGSKDAKVSIIEFSDFQCPFCAKFYEETLPQIEKDYIKTGKARFIYRNFPLGFHQYSQKAAEATECAKEQGKFWGYHNILYEKQSEWSVAGIDKLKDYSKSLGLDSKKFDECLDSGKYYSKIQKDLSDGLAAEVDSTPTFFINGTKIVGAQPYSVFKQAIEQELKK